MAITYPKVILTLSDGSTITWEDTDIIEARLVEEMDPISATLPMSVLDLKIFDAEDNFSVFDENEGLAERQRIDLYEIINGTEQYFGRFYLDEWENVDQQTLSLRAVDIIGVMDTTLYDGYGGGTMTVEMFVNHILADIPETFTIEEQLINRELRGHIQQGTVREALQQMCFASGAAVLTSRRNAIEIVVANVPLDHNWQQFEIGVNDKFSVQPTELLPLVTEIELTSHEYIGRGVAEIIYDEVLSPGIYKIFFKDLAELSMDRDSAYPPPDALIIENFGTGLIIEVETETEIICWGYIADERTRAIMFVETSPEPFIKQNKLSVQDATLVGPKNVQDVLDRLISHYRQRYVHKFTAVVQEGPVYNEATYGEGIYGWRTSDIEVGSLVKIATAQGAYMRSVITKASIDLTGGFLIKFESLGVKITE